MKISDRFTDYGLIGACFWLLQFSVWGISNLAMDGSGHLLQELSTDLDYMPKTVVPYIPFLAALLGALALTAIFTTGLLLDLLGSWHFRGIEVSVFISNFKLNERWLARIVDQNEDYIRDDWSQLLNPPMSMKVALQIFLKGLWNGRYRREYLDAVRRSRALLKVYMRVQAFLLVYVLITPGVEKIEMLSTQMTLWNTSRAIAAAMALGPLETGLLTMVHLPEYINSKSLLIILVITVQYALTGLAFAVSRGAYARVCNTLFAFAYIVASKTPVTIANATSG